MNFFLGKFQISVASIVFKLSSISYVNMISNVSLTRPQTWLICTLGRHSPIEEKGQTALYLTSRTTPVTEEGSNGDQKFVQL
jgi:hypothetical protein